MIYYATYDNNGDYTGFYTKEIHGDNIPTPNIELSEDQWSEAQSNRCRVVNGVHTVIPTTAQEETEKKYAILRSERDYLLSQSDWTQFADSPLSSEKKSEWAVYRQSLRDLPSTVDINNIVYPNKPS
jgi:hypothetical protein